MLKGDLVTTPLPEVLAQLADGAATGCLHVTDGLDDTSKLYLRGGRLYAVTVPGDRPQLGDDELVAAPRAGGPGDLALEHQRAQGALGLVVGRRQGMVGDEGDDSR